MMDMASDEALAEALLDKMLELKLDFWEMALPQLADVVDVVSEADDYGTQVSQLISPRMFRRLMKPRLARPVHAASTNWRRTRSSSSTRAATCARCCPTSSRSAWTS